MGKQYGVRAFAALSGVTAKTLRHYDRKGLLTPQRSAAGYRVYVERDLERLEQIQALTFTGLPLKDVRRLLDGHPRSLASALRAQRVALEEKRRLLDIAVVAIHEAERIIAADHTPHAAMLKRLMEAIDMQRHADVLKRYFSEEGWTKWSRLRGEREGEASNLLDSWSALFYEAESLLGADPAEPRSQEFGERWLHVWERTTGGDPAVAAGIRTAWADRENWPPELRARVAEFSRTAAGDFVTNVLSLWMKRYYTDDAWARKAVLSQPGTDQAWTRLYEEARSLLDEDPAGPLAQDLAARWCDLWNASTGGDEEIQAALRRAWIEREQWPRHVRQHADTLGAPAVAAWIQRAIAARAPRP